MIKGQLHRVETRLLTETIERECACGWRVSAQRSDPQRNKKLTAATLEHFQEVRRWEDEE